MNRKWIAGVAIAGAVIVGGCSQDYKGLGDAGIGKRHEAKREVIVMPDGFANVVTSCDGYGHRIYVTTRDNTTITVIADPTCVGVSAGK